MEDSNIIRVEQEKMAEIMLSLFDFIYSNEEKYIFFSDRICESFNIPKRIDGMPESFKEKYIHPDYHKAFDEAFAKSDSGERKVEVELRDRDSIHWFRLILETAEKTPDGKARFSVGMFESTDELHTIKGRASMMTEISKIAIRDHYLRVFMLDLNGTWKQAGGFVFDTSGIIIKGNELLRRKRIEGREPEWKSDRFSLTEGISMDGCPSWNLKIEGDTYNQMDYMVHEEEIGGKTVTVLSAMGMEYDGRGRIVLATLLREEDHSLVGKDFVSRACKFYNQRPVPSMRMASPPSMDFMMHWPNMGAAPQSPSEVKTEEFWSCSCGNEKNIGRFCTECGSPKPKL